MLKHLMLVKFRKYSTIKKTDFCKITKRRSTYISKVDALLARIIISIRKYAVNSITATNLLVPFSAKLQIDQTRLQGTIDPRVIG